MVGIGFRAGPGEVYYSICKRLDDNSRSISLDREVIVVPTALEGPDLLRFMRINMADVISAHKPDAGFVKQADYYPQATKNTARIHLEGVIQEAVASSSILHFDSGQKHKLRALLDISESELKALKKGDKVYMGLPDWDVGSDDAPRESVLSAVAATYLP